MCMRNTGQVMGYSEDRRVYPLERIVREHATWLYK